MSGSENGLRALILLAGILGLIAGISGAWQGWLVVLAAAIGYGLAELVAIRKRLDRRG